MKRLTSLILAVTLVAACLALTVSAVGNYWDSKYYTGLLAGLDEGEYMKIDCAEGNQPENGGEFHFDEDSIYAIRQKQDATATYVYNKSGSNYIFLAVGCSDIQGTTFYPGDSRKAGQINVGEQRFLRQWIYENGHAYATLFASPIYDVTYSRGVWSPDSVGSHLYAND